MDKKNVLESIKNGLIVSCQARRGWPMYGADIMGALSKAAEKGGAVGIRATGPENIKAIKKVTKLPVLGIHKQWIEECEVYITPTYESAISIIEAGASIVALDGTQRKRPHGETVERIIGKIHSEHPNILVMADCATFEEGLIAEKFGADIISTTLCGYTEETKYVKEVDYDLIRKLSSALKIPIIAEGHIHTKDHARKAIESGAFAVVVGTAITRPEIITKRFVDELNLLAEK
ncbi:N-acetylmannosamine-6-phosphate 2-epimerase [Peribacillus sp. ACCC06369]|uniref:N-acetylmannosamine-6-phosphate 2-epimerase n=1 Tax=Peribacillus sp. ACCC06369 TaxID=3055860 RepID=UPI0025A06887|nr:N-acetylmannosamine-6-phosphate 2-epimerase [Peribacillus sp. ACCC06369]MDM5359403.1 N-acetylmannosamine-6-phosphate 2-epimerase [Peribacillus sp. ACCC06369]